MLPNIASLLRLRKHNKKRLLSRFSYAKWEVLLVKLFPEGKKSSRVTSCCSADFCTIPLWGNIHKCQSKAAASGCFCTQQLSNRKVQEEKRSIIKIVFESTWHAAKAIKQQPVYAKEQTMNAKSKCFKS